METPPPTSKTFTQLSDESASTVRHHRLHCTQVRVFHPPRSLSSDHLPWITALETTANNTVIFRHPLTSIPHSFTLPKNLCLSKLHPSIISLFYHLGESSPWVNVVPCFDFDDITVFHDKIYSVSKLGWVALIHSFKTTRRIKMGATVTSCLENRDQSRLRWRKRFVIHAGNLYLVVRNAEKSFRVYKLNKEGHRARRGLYWSEARGFDGKVLFMARDSYFFRKASRKFPGREYKNCIVFSEAAFPQHGNGCWEFTQNSDRQFSENDIAVFRLDDQAFAREDEWENSGFPKIDWSPPDWILNVSSFPVSKFKRHSESNSSSESEREPDEDGGLDCDSGKKDDDEVQSDLRDTDSEDEEEQEEMETDFGFQNQDQDGVESDLDNQDQDGKMQCDSNSQEMDAAELHVNAITEGGASLQEGLRHVSPSVFSPETGTIVTQAPSLSATEKEIAGIIFSLNGGNNATEEETFRNNITELVPGACTFSTTVRHRSDSSTTLFERYHIRPHLVPTVQKIWLKHGNILEDSAVRSDDMIARGLESLAIMVHILGNNSALSLNDSQAKYLVSTLSDLRYIRFKVDWLIPFVEKAEKLHKSKPLVESLNNLSQLSCQAKERRAMLFGELTKLDEEEKQRKEEISKVSKMIPFCGQVKFDELLGTGLV